jgi:hypothetical protein
MDIEKLLTEISRNFLSNDLIKDKNNFFVCIKDKTREYKVKIGEPHKLIDEGINLDTDLCMEIDIKEAIKLSEGGNNVENSLFNGNIKLIGNLEILNSIASDINKAT